MTDYTKNLQIALDGHTNYFKDDGHGKKKESSAPPLKSEPTAPVKYETSTATEMEKPIQIPEDEKQYQTYTNSIARKYSNQDKFGFVKDRADWPLFVKTQSDETRQPVNVAVIDSAKKVGIRPELLFSSAMEEGMRKALPKKQGDQVDFSGNKDFPVNGYTNFGLDDFGGQFKDLVKKGLLPKDFTSNFVLKKEVNEKGRTVLSADFKTIDDALQAKAAVMKDVNDKVNDFAEQKKIPLSDKAKEFFMLASFNMGESGAQKMMESFNKSGLLKNDSFLKKKPSTYTGVWNNVMKRLVMADVLKNENLF